MARIAFSIAAFFAGTSALANSPMLVDGAGHAIGYYLGPTQCSTGTQVLSRLNYLACIRTYNTSAAPIDNSMYEPAGSNTASGSYFTGNNCQGTPYASTDQSGFVVETSQGLLMAVIGTQPQSIAEVSSNDYYMGFSGTSCTNITSNAALAVPLIPFSSAATGFNPAPYVAPVSVVALPDSALDDEIMFDTFDAGY